MHKKRNSNIELLRIISMIFIVLSHYTVHNGIETNNLPIGVNRYILEISTLGNIGVIIFVCITGYYLIEQKKIKLKKIISLYLQVVFYSVGIYIFFVFLKVETFSMEELVKNFFPIIFEKYWFYTSYILLYILSPVINKILHKLDKRKHLTLIGMFLLVFSILSPLVNKYFIYGIKLIQFIMFYIIGAYIKKYPNNKLQISKIRFLSLLFSAIILLSSVIFFDIMSKKISILGEYSTYLYSRNSPIAILFSVSLFAVMIYRKNYYNKYINKIAVYSFGVYLIHDNELIRNILWVDIFRCPNYVTNKYLIGHMIVCVFITYSVCTIIEYIRKEIFDKFNKINVKYS